MSYVVDKVLDTVVDKVIDAGLSSIDKMSLEKKLKKLLKKSIEDYIALEKIKDSNAKIKYNPDKKIINDIDINLIMPNLSVEKLENNLKDFFSQCILIDDEHKAKSISRFICYNYKSSVADFISLKQIDDDVHELNKSINGGKEEIVKKLHTTDNRIKEMNESVKLINKKLQSDIQYPICFLDELENSKVFCYITMRVTDDVDREFLEEIESEIYAEANKFIDEFGITNIDFNFHEPIIQSEMRNILKYINGMFSQEDIGIISVSTHA